MTDAEHAARLRLHAKFFDSDDLGDSLRAAIERAIELLELNHAKKEHQAEVLGRISESTVDG